MLGTSYSSDIITDSDCSDSLPANYSSQDKQISSPSSHTACGAGQVQVVTTQNQNIQIMKSDISQVVWINHGSRGDIDQISTCQPGQLLLNIS